MVRKIVKLRKREEERDYQIALNLLPYHQCVRVPVSLILPNPMSKWFIAGEADVLVTILRMRKWCSEMLRGFSDVTVPMRIWILCLSDYESPAVDRGRISVFLMLPFTALLPALTVMSLVSISHLDLVGWEGSVHKLKSLTVILISTWPTEFKVKCQWR